MTGPLPANRSSRGRRLRPVRLTCGMPLPIIWTTVISWRNELTTERPWEILGAVWRPRGLAGRGGSWICLAGLAACSKGWGHPPSPRFNTTAWSARWATDCEAKEPGAIRRCAARPAARESSSCPPSPLPEPVAPARSAQGAYRHRSRGRCGRGADRAQGPCPGHGRYRRARRSGGRGRHCLGRRVSRRIATGAGLRGTGRRRRYRACKTRGTL